MKYNYVRYRVPSTGKITSYYVTQIFYTLLCQKKKNILYIIVLCSMAIFRASEI